VYIIFPSLSLPPSVIVLIPFPKSFLCLLRCSDLDLGWSLIFNLRLSAQEFDLGFAFRPLDLVKEAAKVHDLWSALGQKNVLRHLH
jgi:hypothetical protein